jgi:hypothetical protein
MLLLFCATSALFQGTHKEGRVLKFRPLSMLVATIFLFLAVDEFASIHERVAGTINSELGDQATIPHIWLIPYAILGVPVGFIVLRWLFGLQHRLRNRLVLALGIAVAGGFGLEAIAALFHLFAPTLINATIAEVALATLEEILEMVGFAMFGIFLADETLF